MPDLPTTQKTSQQDARKRLLKRFSAFFAQEPQSKADVLQYLQNAGKQGLLDADTLAMTEGVMRLATLRASDIMVPRAQIDVVDVNKPRDEWVKDMLASGHSRLPVVAGDMDNICGILHAKTLLYSLVTPGYKLREHLRPAHFVPETQPLRVLLRDFQATRSQMAIVIDEFGSVSGLLTIEDIIEEITGEINDEFDKPNAGKDNIVVIDDMHWRVKAETTLEQFNEFFHTEITDLHCETVGGVVTDHFERVPHKGDDIEISGYRFKVIRGDDRQAQLFLVERLVSTNKKSPNESTPSDGNDAA